MAKKPKKIKKSKTKLIVVETISSHKIFYAFEVDKDFELENSQELVDNHDTYNFAQSHIDERVLLAEVVSEDKFLTLFDSKNEYLKDWDKKQKLNEINRRG